ncbi:HAD hydrolase family protein, partial [Staphylococcus saprophyticus]|uniref:HAD hydrolase family protein n=1 Tax=Staphylococcus saprophyticus TaxID=29385 RepID=UPI0021B4433D
MDATLLNPPHQISEENIKPINYPQSQPITLLIPTPPPFYHPNSPLNQTHLKLPYISFNPPQLTHQSFNIITTSNLNPQFNNPITNHLNSQHIYYQVYTN